MSTEDNKALMGRFLAEMFNKKNLAGIDEFIAPNHVDHTLPAFLTTTPEGTKRAIGMYLKAFPDLHLTVEDMIAEGDKVVTRFTSHGTQTRAFMGIPQPASRSPSRQSSSPASQTARLWNNGVSMTKWACSSNLA